MVAGSRRLRRGVRVRADRLAHGTARTSVGSRGVERGDLSFTVADLVRWRMLDQSGPGGSTAVRPGDYRP